MFRAMLAIVRIVPVVLADMIGIFIFCFPVCLLFVLTVVFLSLCFLIFTLETVYAVWKSSAIRCNPIR